MPEIGFFTDSASDILQFPELKKSLDLDGVILQNINIGDETFTDGTLTLDQLLVKMNQAEKDTWPHTSQPSVGEFVEEYEKLRDKGLTDIISVHVASKLSGTMNSARLAAEEMDDMNFYLIDAQMASQGIIPSLIKAKELIDSGMEPAKIQQEVNAYAMQSELYAAVPTLENLYKGGRLKPIRFFLGRLLSFKPILRMAEGVIESHDKTRNLEQTQEKAFNYAVDQFNQDDDFELIISHAWAEDLALRYKDQFLERFPDHTVHVGRIGPSMAVHLGPEGSAFTPIKKL